MGLGYPPLTRSRLSPLGGAWEGSRCGAYARSPPAGHLVDQVDVQRRLRRTVQGDGGC